MIGSRKTFGMVVDWGNMSKGFVVDNNHRGHYTMSSCIIKRRELTFDRPLEFLSDNAKNPVVETFF